MAHLLSCEPLYKDLLVASVSFYGGRRPDRLLTAYCTISFNSVQFVSHMTFCKESWINRAKSEFRPQLPLALLSAHRGVELAPTRALNDT
jgi:hypothetical protein